MKTILFLIVSIASTSIYAQLTPDFLLPIHIEDARGNIDTFWYGYDNRAKSGMLNENLGEKLITSPFDSILGIRGYHGRDKLERKYPSKKIIAHVEGDRCPFTEFVEMFVYSKYPPITIRWNNRSFPEECHDFRSEIISKDELPLVVQHWATEAHNYTCMSFKDSLVEDFAYRDTIPWGVKKDFIIEGGSEETVHGYLIMGLGFGQCKQLVSTNNLFTKELKVKGNPVRKHLIIEELSSPDNLLYWEIYAINGRIVKTQDKWKGSCNVNDLSPGEYMFIAHTKKGYEYTKFIKL